MGIKAPHPSTHIWTDYYRPPYRQIIGSNDWCWAQGVSEVPGLQVKPDRSGLPIWGTQHEPYYDKDLFVPEDWLMNYPGSRCVRACVRASLRAWFGGGIVLMYDCKCRLSTD